MADTTALPSAPPMSQQPTETQQNPSRNRRRRPPRRPRDDAKASVDSLGDHPSSEGQTAEGSRPTHTHSGHQRQDGAPSSSNRGGRRGGGRGGRGGGAGGGQRSRQGGPGDEEPAGEVESAPRGETARQRARRGGAFVPGGRQFGGKLSKNEPTGTNEDEDSNINLQTGEIDSIPGVNPGQPVIVEAGPSQQPRRPRENNRNRGPRKPKTVREAEDLMSRIHNDISTGEYECMICYAAVTRKSKVWDCSRCYAVFHIGCIKKWAKQALEAPNPGNDEIVPQRTWRCPGCQNPSAETPTTYTCWCEKSENPEVARYVPPHSCGQTCGKPRETPKNCPHGCDLQCHAGPCPPCSAMGPQVPCFCGKEITQKRCVDTDYERGWSCAQICGDMMPCGEHYCSRPCHEGMCGACEVTESMKCYCGEEEKAVKCCDKLDPKPSSKKIGGEVADWEGFWKCDKPCERDFDCGEHKCSKKCHPQDVEPAHCPFSPDVVKFCPCGKTPLNSENPRQSCTDPIPHCDKMCLKKLPCGHLCEKTCHTGDCGFCLQTEDITCRCGKTTASSLCHQGQPCSPPLCRRICHASLNCLRHECGEICCAGEQKAKERTQSKKKVTVRGRNEDIEPEHICTRVCGKQLKCGTHTCQALCHRGACGSCLEAVFDELACHCGRTRIMPPVPCGTKPPACRFPCQRSKPCGHPNSSDHLCHPDDEACPNCPYLVQKRCVCGRSTIKNQPCWRDSVSCGQTCGKPLSCGSHVCLKACHADGECEDPCRQTCKKSRPICGHDCQDACHAPFACSVDKPCTIKVAVTCPCGNMKQLVTCSTSSRNQTPKRPEVKCIDECRKRQLAAALNVDYEKKTDAESANVYSEDTLNFYIDNKTWCNGIEKTLREFCANGSKMRLAFNPMKSHLRGFIHLLAEDYGLLSESEDPEPYRSVVVTKNKEWKMPTKTLAEALRVRRTAAPISVTGSGIQQMKKPASQAVNAIILSGLRLGLLTSELETELAIMLHASHLKFGIRWYGDEEVLLELQSPSLSPEDLEHELQNIKPLIKKHCVANRIAASVELCWVGRDGKVTTKESQGWSVVAGSKGVRAQQTPQTGGSYANLFGVLDGNANTASAQTSKKGLVLQSSVSKAKNKIVSPVLPKEEPVDDWLEAVESEERKAAESAGASSVEDNVFHSADEDGKSAAGEEVKKEDVVLTET